MARQPRSGPDAAAARLRHRFDPVDPGARRSPRSVDSTSGTSSTPKRPIGSCGRSRPAGRSAWSTGTSAMHIGAGTGGDSAVRERYFHASHERFIRKHYGASGWLVYRSAADCRRAGPQRAPGRSGGPSARIGCGCICAGPIGDDWEAARPEWRVGAANCAGHLHRRVRRRRTVRGDAVQRLGRRGLRGRRRRRVGRTDAGSNWPAPAVQWRPGATVRRRSQPGSGRTVRHRPRPHDRGRTRGDAGPADIRAPIVCTGTSPSGEVRRLRPGWSDGCCTGRWPASSRSASSWPDDRRSVGRDRAGVHPVEHSASADREPVVLVAQRLEPEKRTDVALRAWAASGLADRGWRLQIAGDGAERDDLECSWPTHFRIEDSVDFLGRAQDVDSLMAPSVDLSWPPARTSRSACRSSRRWRPGCRSSRPRRRPRRDGRPQRRRRAIRCGRAGFRGGILAELALDKARRDPYGRTAARPSAQPVHAGAAGIYGDRAV